MSLGKTNLSIGYWNIDGLHQRLGGQRTSKLEYTEIINSLSRFDIMCLVETHCNEEDSPTIDGYHAFHNIRPKSMNATRHFGGISVLIKQILSKGVKLMPRTCSEMLWLKLDKNFFNLDSDLFLGTVYVSPVNSTYSSKRDDILN